jgi:3'-phosphoadenosine 5'-phosphosulfate sulfotransferase (PAPS reductase)/FAD synthetase
MSRFSLFNPRPVDWDAEADAHAILSGAIDEHKPSSVWALFSGGHDSLCSTHIAAQHPRFSGVVTIFTGIGLSATRRFVYETCKANGWPLRIYRPRAINHYGRVVLEHGFPGPAQHGLMYRRLKERSLRRHIAAVKTKTKDRIVLVSGCREAESRVRMGRVEPVQQEGVSVWVAPCVSWENSDKAAYMERHALPRNAVVDLLCMSGECLCGAFARGRSELEEIALWYPEEAAEIEALQERAAEAGVPCRWGERPAEPTECDPPAQGKLWLCHSCEIKRGAA